MPSSTWPMRLRRRLVSAATRAGSSSFTSWKATPSSRHLRPQPRGRVALGVSGLIGTDPSNVAAGHMTSTYAPIAVGLAGASAGSHAVKITSGAGATGAVGLMSNDAVAASRSPTPSRLIASPGATVSVLCAAVTQRPPTIPAPTAAPSSARWRCSASASCPRSSALSRRPLKKFACRIPSANTVWR